jgi:predicted dehydrogenase
MANPEIAGVGAFGDLGTHSLDIMLWMMGNEEVVSVTGNLDTAIARYEGCDEYGEAMLKFKNGAIGTIAAGWVDIANPCSLIVNGTKGAAWLAEDGLHFKSELVENADGGLATELPNALPGAFDLYLDAINGKKALPLVTATEAAICGAVMEAIYTGAKTNSWVAPEKL